MSLVKAGPNSGSKRAARRAAAQARKVDRFRRDLARLAGMVHMIESDEQLDMLLDQDPTLTPLMRAECRKLINVLRQAKDPADAARILSA